MKLIVSSYTLDRAGVPTYTLTLYRELLRLGHDVLVYSPKSGPLADDMDVVTSLHGCPAPDAIIAQHNKTAYPLRAAFPKTPLQFAAHGVLPELEQPPRGIRVDRYTAINTQVRDHLIRQHVPADQIDIVRDFIDVDTYQPREPLRPATRDAPRVLFVSNYKKWKAFARLEKACRLLKWPFKAVGSPYHPSKDMASEINHADLVVSWGRGILEGMACGRPVVSYDKELGDGYLTMVRYWESRERNFCGYECRYCFTVEELCQELMQYAAVDGSVNRELVLRHHHHHAGTEAVLASVQKMLS